MRGGVLIPQLGASRLPRGLRCVFQPSKAFSMRSTWLVPAAAVAIALILAFSYAIRDVPDDKSTFVILHSDDAHCCYDQGLGMSTLGAIKDSYESQGETVFVVDAGDFLQGRPSGTVTAGLSSVEVMNSIGYDVGIPGNHDFDFGLPVLQERADALNYPIICSKLVYPDGSRLYKAMESSYTNMESDVGGFLQISGMTVTYGPDAEAGSRVSSIEIDGKKVEAGKTYAVCASGYVATGGDNNSAFAGCAATFMEEIGVVLGEHIESLGTVTESSIETGRQMALRVPTGALSRVATAALSSLPPVDNHALG